MRPAPSPRCKRRTAHCIDRCWRAPKCLRRTLNVRTICLDSTAAAEPETLAFVADRGARAKFVISACSGSLILSAAGLLKGYKATSHWSVRHVLAWFGAILTDARVVLDRNRITGAGVTAGLDFGLTMVAELRDRTYAECCQLMSEYDPDPPFNSGSMKTAPPEVKAPMVEMLADFVKKSEALANAKKGRP